ncbi:MAG: 50S ribosomal protein L23 [Candidatus Latescibacteria bacterium]|nr:50S ribosomal protein L23 [Candidatus Latescibacterota bacterium]
MEDLTSIIIRPLITERGTYFKERQNTYLFEVRRSVNKLLVKKAVERLFNVKVRCVRTVSMHGKVKRLGSRPAGRRPDWKKAIVTLAQGETIEFFEGA